MLHVVPCNNSVVTGEIKLTIVFRALIHAAYIYRYSVLCYNTHVRARPTVTTLKYTEMTE